MSTSSHTSGSSKTPATPEGHPIEAESSVEAVLRQMRELGLSIEDLAAHDSAEHEPAPTVSEYRPRVEQSLTGGANETYKSYFNDLVSAHGDTPLDRITTTDLKILMKKVTERAKRNGRRGSHGRAAAEHFFSAARAFFRVAVEDGLLERNPAAGLTKPQRQRGKRRPFTAEEQEMIFKHAIVGSDDPALDRLIIWFHLETGARRAGALNLRLKDLDDQRQTLWLHEKYDKSREQPVSATLLRTLRAHAEERGAAHPSDPVFHYRAYADGRPHPMTRKRYNTLFARLQQILPFAVTAAIDSHSLRHTAVAMIERIAGHEVARRFAGHAEKNVTSLYAAASIEEVAAAVALLTGEPHPLDPTD